MTLEHHDSVRRIDPVTLGLRQRVSALRASVGARRVLVIGELADSVALLKLLRYAGARCMAARDLETALHLARRYAAEVIIADAAEDAQALARFEAVGVLLVRLPSGETLRASSLRAA